jgi:integrase
MLDLRRGAIAAPKVKHFAAITKPSEVGALLRAIDGYTGHKVTVMAMRLSPHVLLRPGELRQAEWTDIDFDEAIWFIPAERMKMRRPHRVPLSRQVIAMLKELHEHTHWWRYLFPALGRPRKAMSENAVNQGLRRLGYTTNEMTAHGFRAMAATLLNEMGEWNPDAIERQLAHVDTNQVRRAYARGEYWDERVQMMQRWSDYLDDLRDGGKVLRPEFGAKRLRG